MKRYGSYKDSGVEWLGEIPKEWNTSKIKFELTIFGRIGFRGYTTEDIVDEGEGVISLSPSNITNGFNLKLSNSTFISFEKYEESPEIKVFENDIVLVKTSSIGKVTIIKGESLPKMTLNPQLIVLKKVKPNNRFLYYYLTSSYFQYELQNEKSGGVMSTISQQKIKDFNLIIPPLSEQQQIVSFLFFLSQKIDSLIQQKKKKIELLKEKRTSLINLVVTKGLDPNVEMKYSGVEWIGEIPIHWLVSKIMFISEKVTDGSHHSPETQDSGKLYVTVSNITKENDIDFDSCSKISEESFSELERNGCKPNPGDVLITKDGTIGRGLVVGGFNDYVILSSIGLIRFSKKINPEYGLYYLLSGLNIDQMYSHVRGSGITRLTINLIKNLLLIIPSFSEQQQIVEYLDKQTEEIDTLIQLEQKKIDTLKEYRQSLISEVVTGKIRVCEEDNSLSLNSQTI